MTTTDRGRVVEVGGRVIDRLAQAARRCGRCVMVGLTAAVVAAVIGLPVAWTVFPLDPVLQHRWPASPVISASDGSRLLVRVARDDQWREPLDAADMSPWLRLATVAVEDERFFAHPGVDAVAIGRATLQNVAEWRVVSGASTLTQQIARMMTPRPRTVRSKIIEAFRALQLEQAYSKDDLLTLYLNVAPYGGNISGVGAAARHYFDKPAAELSLAEAAMMAGLPQSPATLRPDRYPERARRRQTTVLQRMAIAGFITTAQLHDALGQAIELHAPGPAPHAVHAALLALQRRPGGGRTTFVPAIQEAVERHAAARRADLPEGSAVAVVVIDIADSAVVALVGGPNPDDPLHGQVNVAVARRSCGSALKPFVYAAAFQDRRLSPDSVIDDRPVAFEGWRPRNFDRTFQGVVTVRAALQSSLNVPALLVAERLGLARVVGVLRGVGVDLPAGTVRSAGLSVVVGGAPVRLLDVTNAYATLGRGGGCAVPRLFVDEPRTTPVPGLSRAVCAAVDDVLSSRRRAPRGMAGGAPELTPWFAWKTGTSAGRRDAWAVGHNGRYAVGVWVGRLGGGGDAAYVGGVAAEPLLAACFADPLLARQAADPLPPEPWTVTDPLDTHSPGASTLRIVDPPSDRTFVAVNGFATLTLATEPRDAVTWFVDGQRIEGAAGVVRLPPGHHGLRAVRGQHVAAVRCRVVE